MLTPRGSSVGPALGLLSNGYQFESPQDHWRFTRSLTSGSHGISRGARKLARTSMVIKKKKRTLGTFVVIIIIIIIKYDQFLSLGQRTLHRVRIAYDFCISQWRRSYYCCCKTEFYVWELYIEI